MNNSESASENEKEHLNEIPYSVYDRKIKLSLVVLMLFCGIWSTLSSSIYFPALPTLSDKFNVSASVTNLSVVAYLIFQALGPILVSPFADAFGRRPVVLVSLISYAAVNVGLCRVNVYWLLVVLRCLQAFCIAPIISVSSGVVGDMCEKDERGEFIGLVSGFQLVGQAFGALLGSGVISGFGWRGVFVFLAIGSGAVWIVSIFCYPETHRLYSGNQILKHKYWIHRAPIIALPFLKSKLTNELSTLEPRRINYSQFIAPLKIFFNPMILTVLFAPSVQFAAMTMAQTTLSTTLESRYGYSVVHTGLCYLAPGFGTFIGSIATGRFVDYIYKNNKKKHQEKYSHLPEDQRPALDLLQVRLNFTLIPSVIGSLFYLMFGWCLRYKVEIAPILIAIFITSFCGVAMLSSLATLLIDLFPEQRSSAMSCFNLMRCLFAALGVGVLQSMFDAMGEGWTYTIVCGISLLGTCFLYFFVIVKHKTKEDDEE